MLREFDENYLQRIAEIFFEDEVGSLPHPPDVSSYLMSEVLDWNIHPPVTLISKNLIFRFI